MTVLLYVAATALSVAAVLCLVRIVRGPSAVDRAIANEVLVATLVCAFGVDTVLGDHRTSLPILLSLALVGFTSSVAIARFVARDRDRVQLGGADPTPEADPSGGSSRAVAADRGHA